LNTVVRSWLSVGRDLGTIIVRRRILSKNTLKLYRYGAFAGGFFFSDAPLRESFPPLHGNR